jgi:hypothetical protein
MKLSVDIDRTPNRKTVEPILTAGNSAGGTVGPDEAVQSRRRAVIDHSPRQADRRRQMERGFNPPAQAKANKTGLPDELKAEMEAGLGNDFSDVRVHPASPKAGEVNALAYTQGGDIHIAPGRFQPQAAQGRQLLAHELAHVVQQRQGRVAPTGEVSGMPLNDDPMLEKEADDVAAKF